MDKYLQCIYEEYRVDQANLIRNINDHLPFIVLSPFEKLRKSKLDLFYKSCMRLPIKVVKHEQCRQLELNSFSSFQHGVDNLYY